MLKENFVQTLAGSLRQHWDVPCFSDEGRNETLTYGDVAHRIFRLHQVFEQGGLKKGDRVALCGRNSSGWAIGYLATITYGAVIVPILPDFTGPEIEHIVRHSESSMLLASDPVYDCINDDKMPSLAAILRLRDFSTFHCADPKLREKLGKIPANYETEHRDKLSSGTLAFTEVDNADLAAIVYTSGTTGFSKGVMLNANSLMANVRYFNDNVNLTPGDNIVSFLPLAHAFGCAFDFLAPLVAGCHITFVEKVPTPKVLLKCFAELRPAVVMSVPLIIEKIYRNKIKPVLDTQKMQFMLKVPGLRNIVYKKIRDQIYSVFGGNYKEMVIGGAALNRDIEHFFRTIGLNITCGYGMTECGPLISYTVQAGAPPVGCVGKIIPYLQCRIADPDPDTGIGEVQVRGENVMLGYYLDEDATAQALDPEGWLMTGDLGRLDEQGFLYLTGRSKNMILSSSGQNIYPEEIESQLNNMPCVEESLIVDAEGKLMALVYPDLESVDRACLRGQQVEDLMEANRRELNKKLPGFSQISKLKVLYQEFEKTPTKKIKRRLYRALS